MIENISVGIFPLTPEGKRVTVNPTAAKRLVYSWASAVPGLSVQAILTDLTVWPSLREHLEKQKGSLARLTMPRRP
jgi:hypothetical protein